MPTLLTIWGIMVTLQGQQAQERLYYFSRQLRTSFLSPGLVTSYAGLITVRAFLGLVEGPMFPGIVLYLSGFYTRKELSLRYAIAYYTRLSLYFDHPRIALFFSSASVY